MNQFINIIKNFKGKKIGIMGDLMLDEFIYGNIKRMSPEAPVPIISVEKEIYTPGGAGNTAMNIAALGGRAFVIGTVGNDQAGESLLSELKKKGVNVEGVIQSSDKKTIEKIRIIANKNHIARMDKEEVTYIDGVTERKILKFVSSRIKEWDAIIFSDYAKGLISENLAQKIITVARKNKKLTIADTKPKNAYFFKNVDFLTPNNKEALDMAGVLSLKQAGRLIQKNMHCNVLITLGNRGVTIFDGISIKHFPSRARRVLDVSGAGDTVTAAFCLSLVSGATVEEAVIISNNTAGIVVGKWGTAVVDQKELIKYFTNEYKD